MRRHQIPQVKMNALRKRFIEGCFHSHLLARELKLSSITTWRYGREFEKIKAHYPEKLADMDFYMPEPARSHRLTPLYVQLMKVLPRLVSAEKPGTPAKPVWRKYRELCPQGYSYFPFKDIYYSWVAEHPMPAPRLLREISEEDMAVLDKWRHSNDHRHWQISVALRMALTDTNVSRIMEKVEAERKTVTSWLAAYRAKGLRGFEKPPKSTPKVVRKRMQDRKAKLVKLLHESPKRYGLNRTSWTITALTAVYHTLYPEQVSYMQVSNTLKQMGYRYKKSRDMLTSQDPKFREKIRHIQRILQKLGPKEKFFSIDEYGPVGIKVKGGRTLRQQAEAPVAIPEKQRSKGIIICTAALELSTNQVSHFFSVKKNTFEMIKLIALLLTQYREQGRLYLCWDAVSWHHSAILLRYIKDHNESGEGPEILLAPLPSCTQFLNVIESVFCGLARAVIHNSDYPDLAACQQAISLHFQTRNQYFLAHPKRAGRKIWGKELVAPRFSETQHTKKRNAMRGAR
jgi:transposase